MKMLLHYFYLTIIFNIFYFSSLSQQTNILDISLNENNNIKAKIDTISHSEFSKKGKPLQWIEPKANEKIDSIYKSMRLLYPNSFKDSSSCLILNSDCERLILCFDTSSTDPKGWEEFNIIDYKFNFLFFHKTVYEGEEYILFNPEKRLIKTVWGYPIFLHSNAIFAVNSSALYGTYFIFQSLINKDYFSFNSDSWLTTNYYNIKNKFYFELSPEWKKEPNKYIRLSLK